jgi:SAM-dependent methyltransferase
MTPVRLVPRQRLDPRPASAAAERPIPAAVAIPFDELPDRTYELPPSEIEVFVVGPRDLAEQVVQWLRAHGRTARLDEPSLAAPGEPEGLGRLWRPNPWLAEITPRLAPGRALDIACGVGREAVFLASCGWEVTAMDILPDAIERARRLEQRYARGTAPVDWRVADVQRGAFHPGAELDLITGFRYLSRALLPQLAGWARPGAHLVWESFTTLHRARHGRPARDADVVHPGELPTLLSGWSMLSYQEQWLGPAHTARVWATRA